LEAPLTLCSTIYTLPMLTIREDKGQYCLLQNTNIECYMTIFFLKVVKFM